MGHLYDREEHNRDAYGYATLKHHVSKMVFFPIAQTEQHSSCACYVAANDENGSPILVGGIIAIEGARLLETESDEMIMKSCADFIGLLKDGTANYFSDDDLADILISAAGYFKHEANRWKMADMTAKLMKMVKRSADMARRIRK